MHGMFYSICNPHGRHLKTCKACSPQTAIVASLRKSVRGALLRHKRGKSARSLEYLGLNSWKPVVEMLMRKIKTYNKTATVKIRGMNFDIDHIKPVSAFDKKDMHLCYHWTNLQPLPPRVNRCKSSTWNKASEAYWRKHIIMNEAYDKIFLPVPP